LRGAAVARKVHGVNCVRIRENLFETSPGVRVLSETVEKGDGFACPGYLHPELIAARRAGRTAICHER